MPDTTIEILDSIVKLAQMLPATPRDYSVVSLKKRRELRSDLESAILHLTVASQSLDTVRQPKHVFDPTSPKVIGGLVAHTLLAQDKEPLASTVKNSFYGAGVYAIYYKGPFPCYVPISGKDHPIYVGKADPTELHAPTPEGQGIGLFTRLKDHNKTIASASNLDLADFECRYLVVRSAWVETAEDLLIDWFRPVWNKEMKVCQGFGKHGDNAETRANKRSPWDELHEGRAWAKAEGNTPSRKDASSICADIAAHFEKNPPLAAASE